MSFRLSIPVLLLSTMVALSAQESNKASKIDPKLRQLGVTETARVLIVLTDQPHADALRKAEKAFAQRKRVAQTEVNRLGELGTAAEAEFRKARVRLDDVVVATRQAAAAEVKRRIGPQQEAVSSRVKSLGGNVLTRYTMVNMLAAEIPVRALDALEADPDIVSVVPETIHKTNLVYSVPAFGAPAMWAAGFTGRGESVGVLDTGIYGDHPGFANVNVVAKVFLDGGRNNPCFADNAGTPVDMVKHGTHVAGIVAMQGYTGYSTTFGVARGLGTLYSLKVGHLTSASKQANCQTTGSFSSYDYFSAIDWSLQNSPIGVFNASFGGQTTADDDTDTRLFDYVVDTYGVTFAIAAGNDGPGAYTLGTPGIAYNVITVASANTHQTATRSDDTLSNFSSRGPTRIGRAKPDITAPGEAIASAAFNSGGLLSLSGTSMAAPHIAGAAALIRGTGVTDPKAIKALLINTTDGAGGWNAGSGWGYANLTTLSKQRNVSVDTIGSKQTKFYKSTSSGLFKTTIAWNRHPSRNNQVVPVMNDLGIKLYTGADNTEVSSSTAHGQNVQQVWWNKSGAMVIKVLAGTLVNDSEDYGIAFSNEASEVSGPALSVQCTGPAATVSAGATFSVNCTASNRGDLDAFGVTVSLLLPGGFSGGAAQAFGTITAGATSTRSFMASAGSASGNLSAKVSSSSFGDLYTASSPNVSITVGTSVLPVFSATPPALSFSFTTGGSTPAAQSVTLGLSRGTSAVTSASPASWLRANLASSAAPTTMSVSVVPGSLAAGSYTAAILVTANGAANSPTSITVTLRIAAASTAAKYESQRMARTIDLVNGCPVPVAVTKFYTTDAQARLWFVLRGTKQGEGGTVEWIGPNNSVYQAGSLGTIPSNGDYCFSPGLDVTNLPPSLQTGNWQARVSWMGVTQFNLTFSISRPVTLISALTTDNVPDNVCTAPAQRSSFFVTDSKAMIWFSVRDFQVGDVPSAKFFKPDGSVYYTSNWNPVTSAGSTRCFWSWIDIAGADAAQSEGTWKVTGFWNGIQYFSFDFTIAPPINVERKLMTGDLTDTLSCTLPNSTKTFLRSDPTAAIWFSVNGANAGDVARVEYIAPNGTQWSKLVWDPLDSGGNWCMWGWLNIASSQRTQGQVGKWTVNAYWNDTPIFTTDFTLAPVSVSGQMLTKATLSQLCSPPVQTSSFLTTDTVARAWFTVDDASTGDVASVEWWGPDGAKHSGSTFTPLDSAGSWCLASSLPIAGQSAAAKTGVWSNRVFWNGVELYRLAFRIDKPAGSSILSVSPMPVNAEAGDHAIAVRSGDGKATLLPSAVVSSLAGEAGEGEVASCGGSNGGRKVACAASSPSIGQLSSRRTDSKPKGGFGSSQ